MKSYGRPITEINLSKAALNIQKYLLDLIFFFVLGTIGVTEVEVDVVDGAGISVTKKIVYRIKTYTCIVRSTKSVVSFGIINIYIANLKCD